MFRSEDYLFGKLSWNLEIIFKRYLIDKYNDNDNDTR